MSEPLLVLAGRIELTRIENRIELTNGYRQILLMIYRIDELLFMRIILIRLERNILVCICILYIKSTYILYILDFETEYIIEIRGSMTHVGKS